MPVSDDPTCSATADALRRARGAGGAVAVGGGGKPVHSVVGSGGDSLDGGGEPDGGGRANEAELGRGARHHGAAREGGGRAQEPLAYLGWMRKRAAKNTGTSRW